MSEYIADFGDERVTEKEDTLYTKRLPVMREEIVRCRDCRWAKPDQSDHDYRGEYRCNMWIADVSADGYCWRGKRKEGGE